MKNIFDKAVTDEVIERINNLSVNSRAKWGKMSVEQMLAHCSVSYDLCYDESRPKATGLKKVLLKLFVKGVVVGEKPYKKNSRTAPDFIIADEKEFENEKQKLISYLEKTQNLGASHFEGKESNSFGHLTSKEWNNMFYKHLDHHLNQFGV